MFIWVGQILKLHAAQNLARKNVIGLAKTTEHKIQSYLIHSNYLIQQKRLDHGRPNTDYKSL